MSQFPNDAITFVRDNDTATDLGDVTFLATSTRTILQVTWDSKDVRQNSLECDGMYIAEQKGGSPVSVPVSYVCDSNLHGDFFRNSIVTFTYVPYDLSKISTATPVFLTQATSTATNTPAYINGFSYGEIVTGFFLFILVTNAFFGGIINRLIGVKQKTGYKIILK